MRMKRQLYPPLILALLVSLVFGALPQPAYADPGWLSGWDKRVKLTIDHTDIEAALSDFPILVYLSTSSGRGTDDVSFVFDELTSDDNRKKIAVTKSDGTTELYVEIEKWDDANEHAWLWVKVPDIASGADTDLYLYYDKDHADNDSYVGDTNSTPAENVWDANYQMVQHMKDTTTSTITDSTVNANDGTKVGAGEPAVTTSGQIDDAQDFDGGNDYVDCGTAIPGDTTYSTIEAWVKLDRTGSGETDMEPVSCDSDASPYSGVSLCVKVATGYIEKYDGGWVTSTVVVPDNEWAYVVVRGYQHATAGYLDAGIDGTTWDKSFVSGDTGCLDVVAGEALQLGRWLGNDHYTKGIHDEIRISTGTSSSAARSDAWIKASYESGRDHLLDWGSEELAPPPTVTTQAASGIGTDQATLNGTITDVGGENCDIRGFDYDDDAPGEPYASEVTSSGSFGAEAFNELISSLDPSTTYYFRAKAHNSAGWGYGSELQFTTTAVGAPTVTTQAASGIGTDQATLNGTITDIGDENCDIRGFDYGETVSYGSEAVSSGDFGTGAFNELISSLSPGATYHFRAKAHNSAGWGYGADMEFATTPVSNTVYVDTGCGDSKYDAGASYEWYSPWTPPGSGTVTVTKLWFWDGDGSVIGTETIYMAMYEDGGSYAKISGSDTTITGAGTTGWISAAVTSEFEITLGTTYWVGATCASGNAYTIFRDGSADCAGYLPNGTGSYYPSNDNVLDASVPTTASQSGNKYIIPGITYIALPTVTTQAASSIGTDQATLNGTITDVGGENCDQRGFDYGETVSYGSEALDSGSYGTGAFDEVISSLSPGTTYHFRAKAHNSAGWGYGSDTEFTTTALPSISNTPSSWAFGLVDEDSSYETDITYVESPASGFQITNNNTYDLNITISATDMGSGWLLADSGDPDATHYTLWAGTELTSPDYNIQVTSGGTFLITVLASSTRDWGLFFFSSRRRHTRSCLVSWARRCV